MLNENIKAIRKLKGLSQQELAVKLNVVRQTISKWEQGLSVPDSDMLIAISEALEARELIKISVLKNCADDPRELAEIISERTRSQVVQVIGKKIVLYREGKDEKKKIILPL